MDYFSDNLYQVVKKKEVTGLLIKIYAYQIFRGLNYLSMLSIAHRDIKPQNILVDRIKHKLIISDFGSAKQLNPSTYLTIQLKQIWHTYVLDATEHLSSYSEQQIIQPKSICGQLDVF